MVASHLAKDHARNQVTQACEFTTRLEMMASIPSQSKVKIPLSERYFPSRTGGDALIASIPVKCLDGLPIDASPGVAAARLLCALYTYLGSTLPSIV